MAFSAVSRFGIAHHGKLPVRDGTADRLCERRRARRDRFESSPKARREAALSLVVPGVPVGEEMPVKVKKGPFTVRGTAVVNKMGPQGSEFEIHIRDSVFGKKVERDVEISVDKQADGSYIFTKTEDGIAESGKVAGVQVVGNTTRMQVPDAKKGGKMVEIQFTDQGEGRFKIRGEDFSAEFNA
ncbi:MAG: hypothetical protein FJZ00_04975 [Candidatus Sericytochromatia bacterium]|uniref:Uncharacterized protein n=1 Tax=Candidatus Tanganyikabacteria bacterium TaxID=2961651 RepID=A0A937X1W5_9BACT|nr:hypothetical protein [Candidatus Tanganyikabacteria bacterium]